MSGPGGGGPALSSAGIARRCITALVRLKFAIAFRSYKGHIRIVCATELRSARGFLSVTKSIARERLFCTRRPDRYVVCTYREHSRYRFEKSTRKSKILLLANVKGPSGSEAFCTLDINQRFDTVRSSLAAAEKLPRA